MVAGVLVVSRPGCYGEIPFQRRISCDDESNSRGHLSRFLNVVFADDPASLSTARLPTNLEVAPPVGLANPGTQYIAPRVMKATGCRNGDAGATIAGAARQPSC